MAANREHREFARRLRREMTDAELFVWSRLRHQQLGHRFRRQHPIGPFVVDFVCLERKLVIELDGGQHAEAVEYDHERTAWLNGVGYRMLRYWNHQVFEEWGWVAQEIWRYLDDGSLHPPPAVG